jgi:D-alanyl-D-alanine carboxypeptidase (penicillin-binding protein 5/6)
MTRPALLAGDPSRPAEPASGAASRRCSHNPGRGRAEHCPRAGSHEQRRARNPGWLLPVLAALILAAPALAASPQVTARAWRVENGATGEVLLHHDDRARVPIASITKLMTVIVALEHADLAEVVRIPKRAPVLGESTLRLRAGERVSVRDLVEAALIQSANDAAHALAYHVGRGNVARFVAMMNAKARALGLTDTRFVRPDGLDVAGHVSSARDVTLLARVAMQQPVIRSIVRLRTAEAAGRHLFTWNDLLGRFPGLIGVKTGHTRRAGWSEVAAARGRGTTIYATILGSPSRAQRNTDLAELLAWGLSRYRVVEAVSAGRTYATAELPYGRAPVALVAERRLLRVVRVGRPLVERVVSPVRVSLPVWKGQRLGEVRIYAGRRLLGTRTLVASRSVARPGLAGRVGWYAGETAGNVVDLFR